MTEEENPTILDASRRRQRPDPVRRLYILFGFAMLALTANMFVNLTFWPTDPAWNAGLGIASAVFFVAYIGLTGISLQLGFNMIARKFSLARALPLCLHLGVVVYLVFNW